jgi:hypothetical protein
MQLTLFIWCYRHGDLHWQNETDSWVTLNPVYLSSRGATPGTPFMHDLLRARTTTSTPIHNFMSTDEGSLGTPCSALSNGLYAGGNALDAERVKSVSGA